MSTQYTLTEDEEVNLHLIEYSNVFDLWVESNKDYLHSTTIKKRMSFEDLRKLRDDINEVLSYFDECEGDTT